MLTRERLQTVQGTHTYCWEDDYWRCPFMQLKFVWIESIVGSKPLLDFISFLLLNSPVLERMTVEHASKRGLEFLPIELLRSKRASGRAEIIYMEPRASCQLDTIFRDPPPPEFTTSSLFSDLLGLAFPPGLGFLQNLFNRARAVLVYLLFPN